MEYVESDLVRIAKRENNTKRGYLVVNPLQGKHISVKPSKALELFSLQRHLLINIKMNIFCLWGLQKRQLQSGHKQQLQLVQNISRLQEK